MKSGKKHYYRYMGYHDGSGKPEGYIFKYYTKDEAECMGSVGLELLEVNETKGECNERRIKCKRR